MGVRASVQRCCDRFELLVDNACRQNRDAHMAEYVPEFTTAMDTVSDHYDQLTSLWDQLGPGGSTHEASEEWNGSYNDALREQETAWVVASDTALEIWLVWGGWFSSNAGTLGRWGQEVFRWRSAAPWKHGCKCGHCRDKAVRFAMKALKEWERYRKRPSAILTLA